MDRGQRDAVAVKCMYCFRRLEFGFYPTLGDSELVQLQGPLPLASRQPAVMYMVPTQACIHIVKILQVSLKVGDDDIGKSKRHV